MRADQRVVTDLPLKELWGDGGTVPAERLGDLSDSEVRDLLRAGLVRFVVADVGFKLHWVGEERCFTYWREHVSGRLIEPGRPASLDGFPGGYCYAASVWSLRESRPIVVLERHH